MSAQTFVLIPVRDSKAGVLDRVHQRPGHVARHGGIHCVHVCHHQHIFAISCLCEFLR